MGSVTLQHSLTKPALIVAGIVLLYTPLYFVVFRYQPAGPILMAPAFLGIITILLMTAYRLWRPTVIRFDDEGVTDPRLGVSVIAWGDIREITTLDKPRRDFGVGLKVKNTEVYYAYASNFLKALRTRYMAYLSGGYICIRFYGTESDMVEFQMAIEELWQTYRGKGITTG